MIKLDGDVLFDFGKSDIKREATDSLQQAGAIIRSLQISRIVRKVMIGGYTDSKGDDALNLKLSEARAKAVAQWFDSHRSLKSGAVVEIKGYGKASPVAPNNRPDNSDDPLGRAKNRRVEIVILKRVS